ncbi:PDR/VanB family oxidoreductase [Variovorax terrae]
MTTPSPAPGPFPARLESIRYAARDTLLIEFRRLDGQPMPAADAGAHIDVVLPGGLARQYSLVSHRLDDPQCLLIAVKRDAASRGGSRYLHESARVGQTLLISEPRNNFPLAPEATGHSVLVAGGIGITPVWSMVQALQAQGRSWELHYACRSRPDAAFLRELQALPQAHFFFDDEHPGERLNLQAIAERQAPGTHFYCCGPGPMLDAFEAATRQQPRAQVHVERFQARTALSAEGEFVVELARSARVVVVPGGKSILDTLKEAGIDVASSCEQGICGACETRVLAGTVDHQDSILSPAEQAANDTMMICCSRSQGERLVLDL